MDGDLGLWMNDHQINQNINEFHKYNQSMPTAIKNTIIPTTA
jgi:hypothetical protein